MPAANSIQSTSTAPTSPQNTAPVDDLESLAGDLLGDPTSKKSDDPFNIDDLL